MSRSRLDEIVEEEADGHVWETAATWRAMHLRIAERAFRHGVERCHRMMFGGGPAGEHDVLLIGGVNVQPATAAENKYTPDPCTDPLCFRRAAAAWMGRSPEHDKGDWCCRPASEQACTNCGHTPHGTDQCKRCASRSILPYCIDRRRDQRRLGLEWFREDKYLFLGDGLLNAKPNRRSGRDRRKP